MTMTEQRLPNITALRIFEVAARHGSLVAAAAELNVTHGAVSKQIRLLEYQLGGVLFERRNRGVHLTKHGAWLAERLSILFADLHQLMHDYRALDGQQELLTVACEPTLCLRMLLPAISDLKHETGLDIRVLAAGGPVDFRRGHADVAIRRNDFAVPAGANVMPLADEWMGPVLSPASARQRPEDMNRLHSDTRAAAWTDWSEQANWQPTAQNMHYEHFYLAIQAAQAKQGVALASIHMVAAELRLATLSAPHGFARDGTRYCALWPAERADGRIQLFTNWLARRMEANVALAVAANQNLPISK